MTDKKLIEFYKQMYLIRITEEKLLSSFSKGVLTGTTHTSIGQEACAVGVISGLNIKEDIIFSNHRGHGHFLTYSKDLEGFFGEVLGKSTGICAGIGGSQHLYKDNFYTNGIQGSIVPVATGVALSEKIKDSNAIVVVFIGDGTMGQGVVYESLNIASLWGLPLMVVLENNRYAQSTPSYLEHSGELRNRASSFDMNYSDIDVHDVLEVYQHSKNIIKYVREKKKPHFLVLNTYRLAAHSKGDDFRDPEEIEEYRKKDPLIRLRTDIISMGLNVLNIENEINKKVENCFKLALSENVERSEDFFSNANIFWRIS